MNDYPAQPRYSSVRFDTAPQKRRAGVTRGALTSAERIRCIQANRLRDSRHAQRKELLMGERNELSVAREIAAKAKLRREAITKAWDAAAKENPEAKLKLKITKEGKTTIQRRLKGKMMPSIVVGNGFTLYELAVLILALCSLAITCGLVYAAFHFITKFW